MSNDSDKTRLIRNEQLLRTRNTKLKNGIKEYFHSDAAVTAAPVDFICECSDLNCKSHVRTSVDEYEQLHKRRNRFITTKNHNIPAVEKIVESKKTFDVVEKPALDA